MARNRVILLCGTPASGKDSITRMLQKDHPKFAFFRKHKVGDDAKPGDTYLYVSGAEFARMIAAGEFIQHHIRYNRQYGVSKSELNRLFELGLIPVIHVGKYENIRPLIESDDFECICILLVASKEATRYRLSHRHPNDKVEQKARVGAYDEERRELAQLIRSGHAIHFDAMVNTERFSERQAAEIINRVSQL